MQQIDWQVRENLVAELVQELNGRIDGGRRNIIVPTCPYCGKTGGKFGIYIGKEVGRKKLFASHCFSCGHSTYDVNRLLDDIGRPDLKIVETADLSGSVGRDLLGTDDELDDEVAEVVMPEGYKRTYSHPYLKSRGFVFDDYDKFEVGSTRGLNYKFDQYVILPIIDGGVKVGYVARHTWSKDEIDQHNVAAKLEGRYEIRRYNNSTDNDFVKLLYNYDSVIEDETYTVMIVEGAFDVIALYRKLELYDERSVAVVATFGKKISDVQIMKLQSKGVRTVIIGYDSDATEAIVKTAAELEEYFDVYVAKLSSNGKDWDEMSREDVFRTLSDNIVTPAEFKINTL